MKVYTQHKGVVVDRGKFEHVMAITLNPRNHDEGIIRVIVSRKGDIEIVGYGDRSKLYRVKSVNGLENFEITTPLEIKGSDTLIEKMLDEDHDFIGIEDPDLIFDEGRKRLHLYFTIPLTRKSENVDNHIILGHAEGSGLNDMVITDPVITVKEAGKSRAKELSFAPLNSEGVRLNLIEGRDKVEGVSYTTVRVAVAKDFGPPWKLGEEVFHPKYNSRGRDWCAGHASPGPLMSREFIDMGKNKLLGFMNGREANTQVGDHVKYGMFSVGLFIYDYEHGKIDWVSKEPLIVDSDAKTITFASQFIQINQKEGILYAHVDDSFVRAYTIFADRLKNYRDQLLV